MVEKLCFTYVTISQRNCMISLLLRAFLINLYKKKWFINYSYNSHESLDFISRSLGTLSIKYQNISLLHDFIECVDGEALKTFCKSYSFHSFIKQRTCFKIPENPSYIHLILTNKPLSFQTKCVIETGLSDFHRMRIFVLKMHFPKLPPKVINYRDFKKIDDKSFMNSLHYALSEEQIGYRKNSNNFFEIGQNDLNKHAPSKKVYSWKQ